MVNYGADQTFTITPADPATTSPTCWWTAVRGRGDHLHLHNVTADHTIAASFAIDTNTMTASAGANGSIAPAGAAAVDYGSRPRPSPSPPARHYHVADVLVDGVTVGPVTTYTFTDVTADHTIAATFAIDTITVTAHAGGNGTIDPGRRGRWSTTAADQTFTITPAPGYHVADVAGGRARWAR